MINYATKDLKRKSPTKEILGKEWKEKTIQVSSLLLRKMLSRNACPLFVSANILRNTFFSQKYTNYDWHYLVLKKIPDISSVMRLSSWKIERKTFEKNWKSIKINDMHAFTLQFNSNNNK